jgi:predicted DNA-binding mobile mystery protein A
MRKEFRQLRVRQLDRAVAPWQAAKTLRRPRKGWIRAVREAIGVSSTELALRMGTSRQLGLQQEKAEAEDRITLKSLREFAQALDCELVYGLVPRSGSFAGAISLRDHAKAKANVLGVEHSMALENQASGHLKQAIDAEATRLASKRRRK